MAASVVLSIDQGTTGSTAMVFNGRGRVLSRAYREFTQFYPRPGWVEHDPGEIWRVTLKVARAALRKAKVHGTEVAAIGITNQRETTVLWERKSGQPLGRAIVWQDRRTAPLCEALQRRGHAGELRKKTGLVFDPYFSATKVAWILDHNAGARRRAEKGEILFGTIDSWLIWKLTGGRKHLTDYTNASRTLLFNIRSRRWDPGLLRLFRVPAAMLPQVLPSSGVFGESTRDLFGAEIPIGGVAGDQQAALFGQACFKPGAVKNTYGTGCFVLMYTGSELVSSSRGLLTTMACSPDGHPAYALEGAIFIAGAAVQWLRDGLGLIARAGETERIARSVDSTLGVYVVPAFVGLGAPYWDARARGAILGITRGVTRAHLVRATLEALAYQTRDVIETMIRESGRRIPSLKADGGASANDFLMEFQAGILGKPVERPRIVETTAMGAAFLAGLAVGFWKSASQVEKAREVEKTFRPGLGRKRREELYCGWKQAVARVLTTG